MHHVKITPKNFDSILKESISRINRASLLRALDDDELNLLAEYHFFSSSRRKLGFYCVSLRKCLFEYCFGTSTFDK